MIRMPVTLRSRSLERELAGNTTPTDPRSQRIRASRKGKSAVARPWQRSFLGFTVRNDPAFRRCIADKPMARFKPRVRELTGLYRGVNFERMIVELVPCL